MSTQDFTHVHGIAAPMASSREASPSSSKKILTPAQLRKLKSGKKISILVGPEGNQFIAIEGAYVSVLAQYAIGAKRKLVDGLASRLSIPGGDKKVVVWIYKYMLANETDGGMADGDKFDMLSSPDLINIYSHCLHLEYESLMDRIKDRLTSKLLAGVLPEVEWIKHLEIYIPELCDVVGQVIARHIIRPLEDDYTPYMKLADELPKVGLAIDYNVQDMLKQRVAAGAAFYRKFHYGSNIRFSMQRYGQESSKRQASTSPTTPKFVKNPPRNQKGNSQAIPKPQAAATPSSPKSLKNPTGSQKVVVPPASYKSQATCYNCGEKGHFSRECTSAPKTNGSSGNSSLASKSSNGSTSTPADSNTGKVIAAINNVAHTAPRHTNSKCYNCGGSGHMARDCKTHQARPKSPRQTRGRRQYQNYYPTVTVSSNDHGIKTCDREVRRGEVTRLGLVI